MGCTSSKTAPETVGGTQRSDDSKEPTSPRQVTHVDVHHTSKPLSASGRNRRGITAESYDTFARKVGEEAEARTNADIEAAQRALRAQTDTIPEDGVAEEQQKEGSHGSDGMIDVSPKDEQTLQTLHSAIRSCFIFNGITETEEQSIVAAMHPHTIKEGEIDNSLSDMYFVCTKGQLFVTSGSREETLNPGDSFGELSLLYRTSSQVKVEANEDCVIYCLERESYKKVIVSASAKSIKENYAFLKRVNIFKDLPDEKLYQLAEAVDRESFETGETIVEQGEEGSMFYLIAGPKRTAQVQVFKTYDDGTTMELMRLGVGSYFGEQALLNDAPRAATVKTATPVQCLQLERSKFKDLLGDLEESMREQHSKREKREMKKIRSIGSGILTASTPRGSPRSKKTFSHEEMKKINSSESMKNDTNSEEPKKMDNQDGNAIRRAASVPRLRTDISLDRLQRFNVLGEGAFGNVHLVKHVDTGEVFAAKQMQKVKVVETRQKKNVINEKKIMAMIDHPFVIRLHQALKDKNNLFLILEYLGGGDMFSVIMNNGGRFSENVSRFYAAIAVTVLGYIHQKKILYRDLKPENMVFDADGYYKFVDFGFAKIVHHKTFTLCGTPEYLAPELVQGRGHQKGVDYWALGILIFEMLAGYSPFADHKNNDQLQIYKNILRGKLRFPRSIKSRHAQDLITRLLKPNPAERLGCLKRGAEDIKAHEWFEHMDWQKLYNKELPAPLPVKVKQPKFDPQKAAPPGDFGKAKSYTDDGTGWDDEF